jgi:hypothetical protein
MIFKTSLLGPIWTYGVSPGVAINVMKSFIEIAGELQYHHNFDLKTEVLVNFTEIRKTRLFI